MGRPEPYVPFVPARNAARRREPIAHDPERFSLERVLDPAGPSSLGDDVRRGLARRQKAIPPKYFYDDYGSRLFEQICELPEYYPTRTEEQLLASSAHEILRAAHASDVIELGSGAATKMRWFLDAGEDLGETFRYHPVDVCEPMLESSGRMLVARYPWLEVRAQLADYERHLDRLPHGERRLVMFLGSTIGNLPPRAAAAFVSAIGGQLRAGEHFLLGADLVKPVPVLEAAYNDSAGVTAEFNRNVLRVINRELGADFDLTAFDHVAFFNTRKRQIEMHLRARTAQRVSLKALGWSAKLRRGETLHTEISRKFTRRGLARLCREGGLEPRGWFLADDPAFALVLCEKT